MQSIPIEFLKRRMWVRSGTNPDEKKELGNFASQIEVICKLTQKTALYLIDLFEEEGIVYVITFVKSKEETNPPGLSDRQRLDLRSYVKEFFKNTTTH